MGINVVEKKLKKQKKITRSKPDLLETGNDTGESTQFVSEEEFQKCDQTDKAATEENASGRKLKKHLKNKKKYHISADKESELAHEGGESEPDKRKVKKTRKNKKKHQVSADEESELAHEGGESEPHKVKVKKSHKRKKKHHVSGDEESDLAHEGGESEPDKGELKRARKNKRKDRSSLKEENKSAHTKEGEPYEIDQISSGEEDCSRGMKKWVKEYYESRPDLEVLQQRIDDFITAYEEQEEQARKDKESKIAEDGWTVVVHRKGGKKTSDPESGVAVGSVSQAAVLHKMDKKKSTEVGLDFYRFQRREAQRSEVMKLQSKFEEDKKRIQQLRAARKFKPY